MSESEQSGTAPSQNKAIAAEEVAPRYTSQEILQGHREALIEHEGNWYRLRLTTNGRLLLTK